VAGKKPYLAVKAFVGPIQRAAGCFASCKVTADSYDPDQEGILTLNEGERVKLRRSRGGPQIELEALMRYRIVEHPVKGPWKVSTTSWSYELIRDGRPTLAFHWHPVSNSPIVTPHAHALASSSFRKTHIPTGRVLIEDVLTLAEELGANPLNAEWKAIMDENRANFMLGATWGSLRPD
jgi:hypothetical protein